VSPSAPTPSCFPSDSPSSVADVSSSSSSCSPSNSHSRWLTPPRPPPWLDRRHPPFEALPRPPPCLDRCHPLPEEPARHGAPHPRRHPHPPHVRISLSLFKVSCCPFPALTIALLVSAPGFGACVHTHGASMNLVDGFPVKLKGSDTAPTARSAALVCCIGEGRMIWVWLGAGVSGYVLPCCVPIALYVCVCLLRIFLVLQLVWTVVILSLPPEVSPGFCSPTR
jgi:hypothetical protein